MVLFKNACRPSGWVPEISGADHAKPVREAGACARINGCMSASPS